MKKIKRLLIVVMFALILASCGVRVSNPEVYINQIILVKDDNHVWATNKNNADYYTVVNFDKDNPNANVVALKFTYGFENPEDAKPEHSSKPLIYSKFNVERDGVEVQYAGGAYLVKYYRPGEYKIIFTANDAKKKSITVVINVMPDVSVII